MAGNASRFIVIADFRYDVRCSELSTEDVDRTAGFILQRRKQVEGGAFLIVYDRGQYCGGLSSAFVLKLGTAISCVHWKEEETACHAC